MFSGGYQTVEWLPYQDVNVRVLLDALHELGHRETDPNADYQLGSTKHQTTTRHGVRLSTNKAFIRPVRYKRKNLRIRTQAHVTR